jgi:hypothetical protein
MFDPSRHLDLPGGRSGSMVSDVPREAITEINGLIGLAREPETHALDYRDSTHQRP